MSHFTKNRKIIISVIIAIVGIGLTGTYVVTAQTILTSIPITPEEQKRNEALGVAQKYVVTSPTFAFDGDINSLDTEYIGTLESFPPQYIFTFAFNSAHGGYGNREGQVLAQVITPHKMDIIVSEGVILSAVTDDAWDELNHQYILKKPESKSGSSGAVTDLISFSNALKSRSLDVELIEEIPDSFFSAPMTVLLVDGNEIQAYEFHSESAVEEAKGMISKDGTQIGLNSIRWMDSPHFYSKGKIIVQYIGSNQEMTSLLESMLGNQFAGS